jgi:hypothetical protein
MFKKFLFVSLSLVPFIAVISAGAELYHYVDNKGITHCTDNISTIPDQYASQIEFHRKAISSHDENKALLNPDESVENTGKKIGGPSERAKLIAEKKRLISKKTALDQKFESLTAEKNEIGNNKDLTDENSIALYNARVKLINQKIRQYKQEEENFIAELTTYNNAVTRLETQSN